MQEDEAQGGQAEAEPEGQTGEEESEEAGDIRVILGQMGTDRDPVTTIYTTDTTREQGADLADNQAER